MLLITFIRHKRWRNCEQSRWRSQSTLVWPWAMSCLDAKISMVPKHQLIVPSTSLAPTIDIRTHKATKPQTYIRSIRTTKELFFSGDRESINFTKIKYCISVEFHTYFTHTVCHMKKTWEGINVLISHKKGNKAISCIKRPITLYLTPLHISANIYLKAVHQHLFAFNSLVLWSWSRDKFTSSK